MRCPPSDRVRGFAPYSGSILIISSIDTKYWFFPGNGLDSVHICLYRPSCNSQQLTVGSTK
ncbi:hypothetical protein DPMN_184793 [Dreissena polymorpha]|uniref:Uncharacterized protein n=1 Tax=Dreissena polymorpha TaxID=45954 RepID=A0A9D4DJW7_DREPO|nr:hypothetical protein DPMN_184755 [Dreissena polymorpha]KAH3750273.1 hypothetical protein DPMN_184793 [Dreissena polymorpha]